MGKSLKKVFLSLACACFLFAVGCPTTNWAHNRRHFKKIREELRELHKEIDRVFFDLEYDPSEHK